MQLIKCECNGNLALLWLYSHSVKLNLLNIIKRLHNSYYDFLVCRLFDNLKPYGQFYFSMFPYKLFDIIKKPLKIFVLAPTTIM